MGKVRDSYKLKLINPSGGWLVGLDLIISSFTSHTSIGALVFIQGILHPPSSEEYWFEELEKHIGKRCKRKGYEKNLKMRTINDCVTDRLGRDYRHGDKKVANSHGSVAYGHLN